MIARNKPESAASTEARKNKATMVTATVVLEAVTAAKIANLRQRDDITMDEYQKRAAEAYALMLPGWPYTP